VFAARADATGCDGHCQEPLVAARERTGRKEGMRPWPALLFVLLVFFCARLTHGGCSLLKALCPFRTAIIASYQQLSTGVHIRGGSRGASACRQGGCAAAAQVRAAKGGIVQNREDCSKLCRRNDLGISAAFRQTAVATAKIGKIPKYFPAEGPSSCADWRSLDAPGLPGGCITFAAT
jgi:hypothetical protein